MRDEQRRSTDRERTGSADGPTRRPAVATVALVHPELPVSSSIERVAAALRDIRRTLQVMAATPHLIAPEESEVLRVFADYDRWLLEAARLMEVEVPVEPGHGTLLRVERRAWVEERLARHGWQLDR